MGVDPGAVVAVLLVVGVVAVLGYLHLQAIERRTQALRVLATERGWQFVDEDDSYVREWGAPFGRGRSRHARNVLIGQLGDRPFVTFDYQYKTTSGSGDSQQTKTHRFAVWLMTLPSPLPRLEVQPEGIFGGRLAAALGMGDLELESEEFNRAFRVNVDDDRYGSAMIHPRMMEFLLATPEAAATSWRIEHDVLISWQGEHAEPDEVVRRLELLSAIVGLVPSYVWKDFGPDSGSDK